MISPPDWEKYQNLFTDSYAADGPLTFLKYFSVEKAHINCASLTLPPALSIRLSGLPEAGLGMQNMVSDLLLGLIFGPYEGHITDDEEATKSG